MRSPGNDDDFRQKRIREFYNQRYAQRAREALNIETFDSFGAIGTPAPLGNRRCFLATMAFGAAAGVAAGVVVTTGVLTNSGQEEILSPRGDRDRNAHLRQELRSLWFENVPNRERLPNRNNNPDTFLLHFSTKLEKFDGNIFSILSPREVRTGASALIRESILNQRSAQGLTQSKVLEGVDSLLKSLSIVSSFLDASVKGTIAFLEVENEIRDLFRDKITSFVVFSAARHLEHAGTPQIFNDADGASDLVIQNLLSYWRKLELIGINPEDVRLNADEIEESTGLDLTEIYDLRASQLDKKDPFKDPGIIRDCLWLSSLSGAEAVPDLNMAWVRAKAINSLSDLNFRTRLRDKTGPTKILAILDILTLSQDEDCERVSEHLVSFVRWEALRDNRFSPEIQREIWGHPATERLGIE